MSETPAQDPTTCQNCGKNPATVKIRRVTEGEEVALFLCAGCAKERGLEPGMEAAGGMMADPLTLMFRSMEETEATGDAGRVRLEGPPHGLVVGGDAHAHGRGRDARQEVHVPLDQRAAGLHDQGAGGCRTITSRQPRVRPRRRSSGV